MNLGRGFDIGQLRYTRCPMLDVVPVNFSASTVVNVWERSPDRVRCEWFRHVLYCCMFSFATLTDATIKARPIIFFSRVLTRD